MTETIQKKNRDVSLDVAKGVLIFLVVWGHSIQFGFGYGYGEAGKYWYDYIYRAIYTFHMPLFMAISGYLFYYSNKKPFKEVMISRLKSIGIPYLTYCTITVLLFAPLMRMGGAESFIIDTYANGYWFLTSVLLNCFIVSLITVLSKNKWIITTLLLLINFSFFFVDDNYLYYTHNYMFTCFIVGYLYNLHLQKPMSFNKTHKKMTVLILIAYLICVFLFEKEMFIYWGGVHLIRNGEFSFHQLGIDTLRCLIGIVASSCFMCLIPYHKYLNDKVRGYIIMLSHYSIGIYCLSNIILTIYYKSLGNLGIEIPFNYITPAILAIVVVIISCVILRFCEKRKLLNLLFLGGR